jgi:hypothetical protein
MRCVPCNGLGKKPLFISTYRCEHCNGTGITSAPVDSTQSARAWVLSCPLGEYREANYDGRLYWTDRREGAGRGCHELHDIAAIKGSDNYRARRWTDEHGQHRRETVRV